MCRSTGLRSLPFTMTVSPLSPPTPSSTKAVNRRNIGHGLSTIPKILFIPMDASFEKSTDPPHLPMRSDDESESLDSRAIEDKVKQKSSRPPPIPRRQESMEYSPPPMDTTESVESSPRLPRRKVSSSNFEEWLKEAADDDRLEDFRGRRHSCPGRGLPNHFQYIVDPDAGGSCPRLPKRCKSIRKAADEAFAEAYRLRNTPHARAASGHL